MHIIVITNREILEILTIQICVKHVIIILHQIMVLFKTFNMYMWIIIFVTSSYNHFMIFFII
jgi:hypothetical protein